MLRNRSSVRDELKQDMHVSTKWCGNGPNVVDQSQRVTQTEQRKDAFPRGEGMLISSTTVVDTEHRNVSREDLKDVSVKNSFNTDLLMKIG